MENWWSVIVNYNDQFDDQSNYIGGDERLGYISASNVSLTALDEDIEYFRRSKWLSDDWWGSGNGKEPQYEAELVPNTDVAEGTAFYDATSTDYAVGGSPFHDARNDDAAADDNGSEDKDEPFGTGFSNFIPLDCTDSPVVRDLDHIINESLRKGYVFYTKEDLHVVVKLWHMKRKAEFKVHCSCGSRVEYTYKCNPSCTFELRASWRGSYWIVHKFNMQHTCNLDLGSVDARNVRAKAVVAYYTRKMRREERIMKPREIMAELLHEFGI
ncbi:hypothetical protein C2S51_037735 [Perilla frutescens var. frutescens]|nr:hypothetical protein C2S51_037735 [Perilla frutescens var. frutescens]